MKRRFTPLILGGLVMSAAASSLVFAQSGDCVGFAERAVVDEGTNGVERVLLADVDNDGDLDLITSSFGDGKLFWYENDEDGVLSPGDYDDRFTARLISSGMGSASDIFAVDLDKDDDLDLIAASRDGFISWFEQGAGNTPVFSPRLVTLEPQIPLGLHAADVDGDTFVDILSASFLDSTIAWYESDGATPPAFSRHVITDLAIGAAAVWAGQVDGDAEGRTDVLAASRIDGEVALYRQLEPVDGEPVFERILIAGQESRCEVTTDIVCLVDSDCPIPEGMTEPESCVDQGYPTAFGATSVDAADLDGDGDVDVVVAALEENKIAWYENDGAEPPAFTERIVTEDAQLVRSVRIAFVDADAEPDLIAASFADDTVAWYRNNGAALPTFVQDVVASDVTSADDVGAGDLDGDGAVDIVSVSSVPGFPAMLDRIAWYPNDSAASPGYPTSVRISRSADGALKAVTADLDRDGDLDVANVGRTDRVSWFRNLSVEEGLDPGTPPQFVEEIVSEDAAQPLDIVAVDLDPTDGDPDLDLITASFDDGSIRWFENDQNGTTNPPNFPQRTPVIASGLDRLQAVIAADLDGDGDMDLVSAERGIPPEPVEGEDPPTYGRIQWYEYDTTMDGFVGPYLITDDAPGVLSIHVADLNLDGDLDLLAAIFDEAVFAWYENLLETSPGNTALFDGTRTVIDDELLGPSAIYGADIDGPDANNNVVPDVVAGAAGSEVVLWYRNTYDPTAAMPVVAFERSFIVSDADDVTQVFAEDINGDGFTDVVAAVPGDGLIAWFENDGGTDPVGFTTHLISASSDLAFVVSTGNIDRDADGKLDVVSGQRLSIEWYQQSGELCTLFDADGDGEINGVELAWIGRAFGEESLDPSLEWWGAVDYTGDGRVDGDDLAVLATNGVFGFSTTDCRFTCN